MTFHQIIKREARRQKLSGYRIAKLSGLHMRTVQSYLAGGHDLVGGRLEKIAAALGLELRPAQRKAKGG